MNMSSPTNIAVPSGVVKITQHAIDKVLRHSSGPQPNTLDGKMFGFRVNGSKVLVLQQEPLGPFSGVIVYSFLKDGKRYGGSNPITYRIPNTVEEVVAIASQTPDYGRVHPPTSL
jgi:hypothetical protein